MGNLRERRFNIPEKQRASGRELFTPKEASQEMVSEEPARSRINEAVDRLTEEFKGRCSPEMVRDFVAASFESYQGSRIVDFVPLLVYKSARNQLGALVNAGSVSVPADART